MKALICFLVLVVATMCGPVVLADADAVFREAVRNAVATGSVALATGKIRVGGADNVAAAVTPSGAWTIDTNGVATLGGNIPVARMTNAAGSLGASIGGNIPIAALTNAVGGGLCVVTNKGAGYTNIVTYMGTVSGTLAP